VKEVEAVMVKPTPAVFVQKNVCVPAECKEKRTTMLAVIAVFATATEVAALNTTEPVENTALTTGFASVPEIDTLLPAVIYGETPFGKGLMLFHQLLIVLRTEHFADLEDAVVYNRTFC